MYLCRQSCECCEHVAYVIKKPKYKHHSYVPSRQARHSCVKRIGSRVMPSICDDPLMIQGDKKYASTEMFLSLYLSFFSILSKCLDFFYSSLHAVLSSSLYNLAVASLVVHYNSIKQVSICIICNEYHFKPRCM